MTMLYPLLMDQPKATEAGILSNLSLTQFFKNNPIKDV